MDLKKCSKCFSLKAPNEFHGGPKTKKSKCKECTMDEVFIKKQEKLKAVFDSGDTKVDQCACGNYYKSEIPRGKNRSQILFKCRACLIQKNDLTYKKREGEIGLRKQLIFAIELIQGHPALWSAWNNFLKGK